MQTIHFEGTDAPIDVRDLADFLRLFQAAYSVALPLTAQLDARMVRADHSSFEREFTLAAGAKGGEYGIEEAFQTPHGSDDLQIVEMKKQSPLEITVYCVAATLTLAVIVSGGTVEFDGAAKKAKFKVPPLGYGIKKLREAFAKATPKQSNAAPLPDDKKEPPKGRAKG